MYGEVITNTFIREYAPIFFTSLILEFYKILKHDVKLLSIAESLRFPPNYITAS